MTAPTPVTMKSIERLSGSSVRPSGIEKLGPRSIQERRARPCLLEEDEAGAEKLPSTAPTEIKAA
jgi:hypothetical protein